MEGGGALEGGEQGRLVGRHYGEGTGGDLTFESYLLSAGRRAVKPPAGSKRNLVGSIHKSRIKWDLAGSHLQVRVHVELGCLHGRFGANQHHLVHRLVDVQPGHLGLLLKILKRLACTANQPANLRACDRMR